MARKLALSELTIPLQADVARFQRMLRSPEHHLSPEGRRVLAAARVGLQLLNERTEEVRRARASIVPQLHARRNLRSRAVAGGTPVCESNLPGCIQEMLTEYRRSVAGD